MLVLARSSKVTPTQRKLAKTMDRDVNSIQRIGVGPAASIGWRLRGQVLRDYGQGLSKEKIKKRAIDLIKQVQPLLVSGMVAAHLSGRKRALTSRPPKKSLSLSEGLSPQYRGAIKALADRLDLSPEELEALEELYHAEGLRVLKGASDEVEEKLERAMLQITEEGMHVKEGKQLIAEAFDLAGITPENSYTFENLFRTQTQLAYGAGRWNADQDPSIQSILWGYRYATVGDNRVRPGHQGLEGVTAPKDDPIWNKIWPPNGYSCRCVCIPLYDEQEIIYPPDSIEIGDKTYKVGPDEGFEYNPGKVFKDNMEST